MPQLKLGDITIDVTLKDIKNVHLSVHPPSGRVRISAPRRVKLDALRVFAISKIGWIRKQQSRFKKQGQETKREFTSGENHFYNGECYLLKVVEHDQNPQVILKHSVIELYVRPGATIEKRKAVLDGWYRQQLKDTIPKLIEKWEPKIGVSVNEFAVKRMRTRWGTCNRQAKRIWLNLELAKKPPECLEYVVVHEIVHLLERTHNDRFRSYMDRFLPKWRFYKDELNRFPLNHEKWEY